jgi:predicted  nucleic acid-binding Zn-ribbon protein
MTIKTNDRVFEGNQYGQEIMDRMFEETSTVETFKPGINKDKYIQELDIKIEQLETMINDMKDKSKNLENGVRAEFEKDIKKVQLSYDEAKSKINEIRQSGEEAWQELHEGVINAWKDLADGVKSAITKFQ